MTADLVVYLVALTVFVAALTIGAVISEEKPEWIDRSWKFWR